LQEKKERKKKQTNINEQHDLQVREDHVTTRIYRNYNRANSRIIKVCAFLKEKGVRRIGHHWLNACEFEKNTM
jgi:hypothetical protein